MIFGDLGGLKLLDICLTGGEKPRKKPHQETCPDRGSNPGQLRDRRACYYLAHNGGLLSWKLSFISLVHDTMGPVLGSKQSSVEGLQRP